MSRSRRLRSESWASTTRRRDAWRCVGQRRQLLGAPSQLGAEPRTAQHETRLGREVGEQAVLDRRQRLVRVLLEPQDAEPHTVEGDVERSQAGLVAVRPVLSGPGFLWPGGRQLRLAVDHEPDLGPPRPRALREQACHPQRELGPAHVDGAGSISPVSDSVNRLSTS